MTFPELPCGLEIYFGTACITDLDKLNLARWFDLRLESIFYTAPAASKKMQLTSKVVKSDSKIIILLRKSTKSVTNFASLLTSFELGQQQKLAQVYNPITKSN